MHPGHYPEFWEDDVLKELRKTEADHGLSNAWSTFLTMGSTGAKSSSKVQGRNPWLGPGVKQGKSRCHLVPLPGI